MGLCTTALTLSSLALSGAVMPPVQTLPDTQVVRAIQPPGNPLPPESATADSTRFSFIVYGDTRGRRDGTEVQYEHSLVVDDMLRTIERMEDGPDPVRFVLQSGDAVVDGRDPTQWNASFVDLINRLTVDGGLPYFLAAGNHDVTGSGDVDSPRRAVGLGNFLRAMENLMPRETARRLEGYPTYAFGYGNTFFLAFDSNIAADSVQLAWAEAQLAGLDRARYVHVVALFHNPPFSSGPHGGPILERPAADVRTHWMPLFRRHGVELLFTGHEHFFEHWVERYTDGTGVERTIDQIVTGGGGAPLYAYRGDPDLREYRAAGAGESVQVRRVVAPGPRPGDNPYHYLVVHVDGPEVWLEVMAVDWGRGFAPYRSARTRIGGDAGGG